MGYIEWGVTHSWISLVPLCHISSKFTPDDTVLRVFRFFPQLVRYPATTGAFPDFTPEPASARLLRRAARYEATMQKQRASQKPGRREKQ